jgi:hypothetical protein
MNEGDLMWALDRALFGVLLGLVAWGGLAVPDFRFEPLKGVVQPFLMGRSDRLELDADPLCAAPADDGMFDQDRNFLSRNIEKKIHLHARDGPKGTFKPTSFA